MLDRVLAMPGKLRVGNRKFQNGKLMQCYKPTCVANFMAAGAIGEDCVDSRCFTRAVSRLEWLVSFNAPRCPVLSLAGGETSP
jgi:hypothetical protein